MIANVLKDGRTRKLDGYLELGLKIHGDAIGEAAEECCWTDAAAGLLDGVRLRDGSGLVAHDGGFLI